MGGAFAEESTVAYLASLFRNPSVFSPYLLEQVAQGIRFLIGEASPAQQHMRSYLCVGRCDQKIWDHGSGLWAPV